MIDEDVFFFEQGVYGDAVYAPFSWRFRMKIPRFYRGKTKNCLGISIIKKVTIKLRCVVQ